MFYTDTNGEVPVSRSTALYMLSIVMESTPLDEIDFNVFREVASDIDSGKLDIGV